MLFSSKFRCPPPPRPEIFVASEHLGTWVVFPYNVFADTLTLFKEVLTRPPYPIATKGADYAHRLDLYRIRLESFRRACRIINYCCCHFSLRFSPFRSTYNTHVGKSSVSYSIQHSTAAVVRVQKRFLFSRLMGLANIWNGLVFPFAA